MSDLHLEFAGLTDKQLRDMPSGDVLVLAGDIFMTRCLDPMRTDGHSRKQRKRVLAFFDRCVEQFEHVLYVTGNHEYYGYSIQETHRLLTHRLPKGITWLYDNHVDIDGVLFVGGTLWTDLDEGRGAILWQEGMNDSPMIKWLYSDDKFGEQWRNLHPPQVQKMHTDTLRAIKRVTRHGSPVVVVTHHCPDHRCENPAHAGSSLWPGYLTRLAPFITQQPNIKAWICGHTHNRADFEVGDQCRVYMNCRGYVGHEQMAYDFSLDTFFEIDGASNEVAKPDNKNPITGKAKPNRKAGRSQPALKAGNKKPIARAPPFLATARKLILKTQ